MTDQQPAAPDEEPVDMIDGASDPGDEAPRPQRAATLVFTQAVLALQSLAALFATLVLTGLARAGNLDLAGEDVSGGWLWGGGLTVMVLLAYASSKQATRWGRIMGWVLQAPMLAAGVLLLDVAIIGLMFLVLWIVGLRLGGRIDRERAERLAAEQDS